MNIGDTAGTLGMQKKKKGDCKVAVKCRSICVCLHKHPQYKGLALQLCPHQRRILGKEILMTSKRVYESDLLTGMSATMSSVTSNVI